MNLEISQQIYFSDCSDTQYKKLGFNALTNKVYKNLGSMAVCNFLAFTFRFGQFNCANGLSVRL